MMFASDSIVTESASKQIEEQLRRAIQEGRLRADQQLPTETELAERFGVSRPTIREALKRLAAQNLIRSKRGPAGGNFVTRPSLHEAGLNLVTPALLLTSAGEFDAAAICEARTLIESNLLEFSVTRRTDDDLAELKAALNELADPALGNGDFCAAEVRLHRTLVRAAGNKLIEYLSYAWLEGLQPIGNLISYRLQDRERLVALHGALVAAVEARDLPGAQRAFADYGEYRHALYDAAVAQYVERGTEPESASAAP